jgi:Domain of unknown function (DUF5666)
VKIVAFLTAAALITGVPGFAAAQTTTTAPAPAPAKKSDKKMASKSAAGTVKSATADSVVVAGKEKGKDAEWTFGVDSKTSVKKGGKAIAAGDLKAGDNVSVRYMDHDGKAMAQAISVREAKPAEKK